MDIANYSADSRTIIKVAKEVASTYRHAEIEVEHLLMAICRHEGSETESILNQLGKSPAFVESVINEYLKDQPARGTARANPAASPAMQQVLAAAIEEKSRLYDPLVEPEHILIAAFDPKSGLAGYVRDKVGITKEDIYKAIADSKSVEEIASTGAPAAGAEGEPGGKDKVAGTLRYCTDMTNQAAAGKFDPMIGREQEVQQVIQILLRRRKNSPVLVGGAGVGKSAIVEGFAQAVIDKKVPKALQDVRVLEVDMGGLVAGAKYKGEFEERFKNLVGEVVKAAGKVVLFIDEIHTLMGAGSGSGGMDAANLIKPPLARGQLRVIGATTEEEYTKHIEKDKALTRRFEKVVVDEPGFNDALRIVQGVAAKYEGHHKIKYTPEAMVAAVKYSQRYLSERNLPDIALDIIDEAGSEFAVREEFARGKLPHLKERVPELQKLFQACAGKDPEKDPAAYDQLHQACDEFFREVDRLKEMWGHRFEKTGEVA